MRTVLNVIWLLLCGIWLAIGYVLAVTIIGIPLAWANLKLVPVSLVPLGRIIVPTDAAQATRYPVVR